MGDPMKSALAIILAVLAVASSGCAMMAPNVGPTFMKAPAAGPGAS